MAGQAYTPGLVVSDGVVLRKERKLPLVGDVLAEVGDRVEAETVVARTDLPGEVHLINIAGSLGVPESDVESALIVELGERVEQDQVIAETRGIFGLFRSRCRAPAAGALESISRVTGQAVFREPPTPLELGAYVRGEVVEVLPGRGVVVETQAGLAQGILGIGGETVGRLAFAVDRPDVKASEDAIEDGFPGCVVVMGSRLDAATVDRAREVGVRALVAGGIDSTDLRTLLGHELGVAITGTEDIGLSIVITEGFGEIPMADHTFKLLRSHEGEATSVNGTTQIRAGVLRPEVVIPLSDSGLDRESEAPPPSLAAGATVRVIRGPRFGALGTVTDLPVGLVEIDTEAHVRVLTVTLSDGTALTMPRANVEIIQQTG